MRRVSSADLIRNFSRYSDLALREPVIVTKNGRERLVLVSVEEFNLLQHVSAAYEDEKDRRDFTARSTARVRRSEPGKQRRR